MAVCLVLLQIKLGSRERLWIVAPDRPDWHYRKTIFLFLIRKHLLQLLAVVAIPLIALTVTLVWLFTRR